MRKLIVVLLGLCIYFISGMAKASDIDWNLPQRHGFTFEVGIAEGLTNSFQTSDPSYIGPANKVGFSPPSLSLGAFVEPDTAIMFREVGTAFYSNDNNATHILTFWGPAFQQWVGNHLFFGLGLGVGSYSNDPFDFGFRSPKVGFGVTERIGLSMISERHISVALTADMLQVDFSSPHALPDTLMGGESIGLQFQYY